MSSMAWCLATQSWLLSLTAWTWRRRRRTRCVCVRAFLAVPVTIFPVHKYLVCVHGGADPECTCTAFAFPGMCAVGTLERACFHRSRPALFFFGHGSLECFRFHFQLYYTCIRARTAPCATPPCCAAMVGNEWQSWLTHAPRLSSLTRLHSCPCLSAVRTTTAAAAWPKHMPSSLGIR